MRTRRRDVKAEEIEQMRAMEAEGKSRKEIGLCFRVSPSVVTRHLGAVRCYRDKRRAA